MKKLTLTLALALYSNTVLASESDYKYISEIPEIIIQGESAKNINCTISRNPLARVKTIKIDLVNKSALLSSNILGDSESETECSRLGNSVVCNGIAFNIIIEDILSSASGTGVEAVYEHYGILGVSQKDILCNVR